MQSKQTQKDLNGSDSHWTDSSVITPERILSHIYDEGKELEREMTRFWSLHALQLEYIYRENFTVSDIWGTAWRI
ncbi:hypothetical protein P8452_57900 [Trifolium repens]|nr:hypothetical protein P8452_57900 [Trifolium repens]